MSTTTVMYVNVDRSTSNIGEVRDIGGEARTSILSDHVDLIRQAVESHHGRIDRLHDEAGLARFDSSYSAVRAARLIQQSLDRAAREHDLIALAVRIAMAVGEVTGVDDENNERDPRPRSPAVR